MANTHSLDLELSSSQYAYASDSASLSVTGDFSIEAWVKLEQLPSTSASDMTIVSKYNLNSDRRSFLIRITQADKLEIFYSQDGAGTNITRVISTNVFFTSGDVGTWVHVTATFDVSAGASGVTFYKNEDSVGTTTTTDSATSVHDNTSRFQIGSYQIDDSTNTNFGDFKIDGVRLWNDVRTGTEVVENYGIELVGDETGLVGCWQLDNVYTDKTSNGNDLTSGGSPVFSTDIPFINNVDILTANAADARVTASNASFATARASTTGTLQGASTNPTGVGSDTNGSTYNLRRFFMYFDASNIDSGDDVDSATFDIEVSGITGSNTKVVHLVESSAATTVVADDFNNISFTSFGSVDLNSVAVKQITINSAGLTYLENNLGGNIKLAIIGEEDQENDATGMTDFGVAMYAGDETIYLKPTLTMEHSEGVILIDLTETITITDILSKTPGKLLTEDVVLTDTIENLKVTTKELTETITITDIFSRVGTFARTLTETITITDTISKATSRLLTEAITIVDTFGKVYGKVFIETITITDSIRKYLNGFLISIWSKITKPTATFTKSAKPDNDIWTKKDKPEN